MVREYVNTGLVMSAEVLQPIKHQNLPDSPYTWTL